MHVLYSSQTYSPALPMGRYYVNVLQQYLKLIQNEK